MLLCNHRGEQTAARVNLIFEKNIVSTIGAFRNKIGEAQSGNIINGNLGIITVLLVNSIYKTF